MCWDGSEEPAMLLKLAMMASVVIFCGVGWFLCQQQPGGPTSPPETITMLAKILGGVAVMQALMMAPILTRSLIQRQGYTRGVMLIKLAFYESGALYGLILTILSHDIHYLMYFAAPAMILMSLTRAADN